jgi:LacI family transcriptional regulator
MGRTFRVCLLWQTHQSYGSDVLRGIAEYARRYGSFRFLLDLLGDFPSGLARIGKRADIDGIIILRDRHTALKSVSWPLGVPIVSLEQFDSGITPWRVVSDEHAVGRLVAEELIKRRFTRFAYCPFVNLFRTAPGEPWDPARLEGFSHAVRERGGHLSIYQGTSSFWGKLEKEWTDGRLAAWLKSLATPVGIMAVNDLRARHVLLSAAEAGLRVPEEIAVIGVGNEQWADMAFPGLSSVELDGFAAGYAAARMLHQLIEGKTVAQQVVRIPPRRLITRRSSDSLAISDPDVVTAIRYIAENAHQRIEVRHVVDAVPVSRRMLERRFRRAVDRSIQKEIRLAHIERAKMLLADGSLSLSEVARMSGFDSAKSMGEIFQHATGKPPRAYRAAILATAPWTDD